MANFFTRDKDSRTSETDGKISHSKNSDYAQLDDRAEKLARKPRGNAAAELKAGRWVAPIILLATMLISGLLWIIRNLSQR